MKKIPYFLLFGLSLGLSSCIKDTTAEDKKQENDDEIRAYIARKNIPAKKTESGLYYVVTQTASGGRTPVVGDQVTLHYIISRISDDVIIDSTQVAKNKPLLISFGGTNLIPGLTEGISLLREGEKATLLIPAHLAYGDAGSAALLPYAVVRYDVSVLKVRSEEEQIVEYTNTKNLKIDKKTESGLRFTQLLKVEGVADTVKATSTVSVKYTGKLLDDTQFDSGTAPFNLGTANSVVKGFLEGLVGLRVGDKARLIFPSSIAYGKDGRLNETTRKYTIPPYSPLVFEVEIISVTK
ncbi:MAG: FKBP-type peptidyl-prolyl cis-trans isomerase [Cytophagaceae bacterium]|nr:FKBP-type peptidyl-prolyl cis-trans isomerase [Cytophagaceae bacterium]